MPPAQPSRDEAIVSMAGGTLDPNTGQAVPQWNPAYWDRASFRYVFEQLEDAYQEEPAIRIMSLNVLARNRRHDQVLLQVQLALQFLGQAHEGTSALHDFLQSGWGV